MQLNIPIGQLPRQTPLGTLQATALPQTGGKGGVHCPRQEPYPLSFFPAWNFGRLGDTCRLLSGPGRERWAPTPVAIFPCPRQIIAPNLIKSLKRWKRA